MNMDKFFRLAAAIAICFIPGLVGGAFTEGAIDTWYVTLDKPFFSPPNFLFAPVWTTLYILMGLALYLVWSAKVKKKKDKDRALAIFSVQLILNALWSILFFGARNPAAAFVEILILWVMIFVTILAFSKISRKAGLLLIPYILWVSFAAILNLAIVILNP